MVLKLSVHIIMGYILLLEKIGNFFKIYLKKFGNLVFPM